MKIRLEAIGRIHTGHTSKDKTPIQGVFRPDAVGTVEIFPEFTEGLKDIELFSHLYLFYHFDRAEPGELVRHPFWTIPPTASLPRGIPAGPTASASPWSDCWSGGTTC